MSKLETTTAANRRGTRHGVRGRARRLPSLEPAAQALLEMLRDPDVAEHRVLETLAHDVALSGNVLAVANSPYYGLSREVGSLRMALRLLGFDALRHLVYAATVQRLFRHGRLCAHFDAACLWYHSATTGALARRLATVTGDVDPQAAFLGGLLHDVGHIVAAQQDRNAFCDVVATARARAGGSTAPSGSRELDFACAEREAVGASHAQLGAEALVHWRFPDWAAYTVACHHAEAAPEAIAARVADTADVRALVSVVRAADALSALLPGSFGLDLDVGCEDRTVGAAPVDIEALPAVAMLGVERPTLELLMDEAQRCCGA